MAKSSTPAPSAESGSTQRADDLFFSSDIEVFVCGIHGDQRPVGGAAGLIDWRLKGLLSRFLKAGSIKGTKGEITLIPVFKGGRRHGLLLVGLGPSGETILPAETKAILDSVRQRLLNLKMTHVAISVSSFSFASAGDLKKQLKSLELVFSP